MKYRFLKKALCLTMAIPMALVPLNSFASIINNSLNNNSNQVKAAEPIKSFCLAFLSGTVGSDVPINSNVKKATKTTKTFGIVPLASKGTSDYIIGGCTASEWNVSFEPLLINGVDALQYISYEKIDEYNGDLSYWCSSSLVLTFSEQLPYFEGVKDLKFTITATEDESVSETFTFSFNIRTDAPQSIAINDDSNNPIESEKTINGNSVSSYQFSSTISPVSALEDTNWSISNWYGNDCSDAIQIDNKSGLLSWNKEALVKHEGPYKFDITASAAAKETINKNITITLDVDTEPTPEPNKIDIYADGKLVKESLKKNINKNEAGEINFSAVVGPEGVSQEVRWEIKNNQSGSSIGINNETGELSWDSNLTASTTFTVVAKSTVNNFESSVKVTLDIEDPNNPSKLDQKTIIIIASSVGAVVVAAILIAVIVKMVKSSRLKGMY